MIPSYFDSDVLHPDLLAEEGGALDKLFVRIAYDLFKSDYPGLSYHAGGGTDGAVDLWNDVDARRCVFECKQIGKEVKQQHWEAARDRWRKVYRLLAVNLPLGPDRCRWLRRPGLSASMIKKSVWAWLDEHAEWADADFVLNAWLIHDKAETYVVQAGFDRWMKRHGSDWRARIVRENWEHATKRERTLRLNG